MDGAYRGRLFIPYRLYAEKEGARMTLKKLLNKIKIPSGTDILDKDDNWLCEVKDSKEYLSWRVKEISCGYKHEDLRCASVSITIKPPKPKRSSDNKAYKK